MNKYLVVKRALDLIIAIILLVILAIPMILIAIVIKVYNDGPVIYKSKRIGKNMKPFNTYKFRTMITNRKELESILTHEEMTTKVGKILRKTSLDELPQLFNIIKGEMSFIGPRPWIPEYYKWFTDEQKRRTCVTPGISGLAQVEGRNGISIFKFMFPRTTNMVNNFIKVEVPNTISSLYEYFRDLAPTN